ncbi:MAG: hypothetical protein KTR30_04975 [Saprospiraceae bacterium]|nr:hypothetical protein [Saprospiraceae bacterium]
MKVVPVRFFWRSLKKELPLEDIVDEVRDFDERFSLILNKHLAILAWWCFFHLVIGVPLLIWCTEWIWYFALMNISWALINLWIVFKLYDHIYHRRFRNGNVYRRFQIQQHVEKMLFLNVGLDLSYILAGFYMTTWANAAPGGLWLGFGYAVVLQGAYLLIHDTSFLVLHHLNYRKCKPFLEDVIETQIALRKKGVEVVNESE